MYCSVKGMREAGRQEVADGIDLETRRRQNNPTSHKHKPSLSWMSPGQACRALVQMLSRQGHPMEGVEVQAGGRALAHRPARPMSSTHPPSSSSLFSCSHLSFMPLYTTTSPHNYSAKMLAARGIYKAVARRGVHTTRVLASTKRK